MIPTRVLPATFLAGLAALVVWWSPGNQAPLYASSRVVPQTAVLLAVPGLAPVPVREGVLLINLFDPAKRDQPAVLFTPEGKEVGRFAMGAAAEPLVPNGPLTCGLAFARLSPDGKRLAAFKFTPIKPDNPGPWLLMHLWIFDLESKEGPVEALRTNIKNPSLAWSPDGTKLFVSEVDPEKATDPIEKEKLASMISWVYDFKTKTKSTLALPSGHEVVDVSSDGKFLLTRTRPGNQWGRESAHVIALNTLQARQLTAQPFLPMRFSPDGKEVIGYRSAKKDPPAHPGVLVIASVADGLERTIALPATAINVRSACWSPDGKRIAFEWSEPGEAPAEPDRNQLPLPPGMTRAILPVSRVTVADFDGTRSKTVIPFGPGQTVYGIDWR